MKKVFYLLVVLMISQNVLAQNPFVTKWKTDNAGTSNSTSITIPTTGTGYLYDVDWNNDGTFEQTGLTGNVTHNYGTAGTYTVAIRGTFPRIFFNFGGDKSKILSIEKWGNIVWQSMARAFWGCNNLVLNATDVPNTAAVTDMSFMFYHAKVFNQNIGNFNIANAIEMTDIFRNSGISSTNYDAILIAWNSAGYTNKNLGNAAPLTYCAGQAARTNLTTVKGWTITGDMLSQAATATQDMTWNGSVNTDWRTPCNWSPRGIPTATNQVIIPATTNKPTISRVWLSPKVS